MNNLKAILNSKEEPTILQLSKLQKYLEDKYQSTITIEWQKEESLEYGFTLQVGEDFYDWTLDGMFEQLTANISTLDVKDENYV